MTQHQPFRIIRRAPTRWEQIILLAVVALGFVLRFRYLGALEWNIDQAYPVWQALRTLDAGRWPLVGQGTSILFANPPVTGYLFAPVLAVTRSALAVLVAVLILNSFAVYLTFRGLRWVIGPRPALVGAALFAINAWLIVESRRTWVQCLQPFFVALIFWLLVPVLLGRARHPGRRLLLTGAVLAVFVNTYLLSYALLGTVGVLGLIFWRRLPKRALLVSGGLVVLLLAVYAYGLLAARDDTRHRLDNFRQQGAAQLSSEALEHAVRLVTGHEYPLNYGRTAPISDWQHRADLTRAVHYGWLAALVAGGGVALYQVIGRRPEKDAALILLVWFGLPVLLLSYVSAAVHPHYLVLSVPAGAGLAAWGTVPLLRRPGLVALLAGFLMFSTGVNALNTARHAQESQANASEHYPTLTLADVERIGQVIDDLHDGQTVVFSTLDEWVVQGGVGRLVPYQHLDAGRVVVVPAAGSLYMQFEARPADATPPYQASPAHAPLPLADGTRFTFWQHRPPLDIPHATAIPSDVGLSFVGWVIEGQLAPGQTVTVTTYWQVDTLLPERFGWTFGPFVHVFDASQQRIYNGDGVYLPPTTWRQGDLIIQRIDVPIAADSRAPYRMITGLYDGNRQVNAIFRVPQSDGSHEFTAALPLQPLE